MGLFRGYHMVVRRFEVVLPRLPAAFDGLTIVQVSDVHNALVGDELAGGARAVLDAVTAACPDLVAVTGDLVDKRRPHLRPAVELAAGLVALAPTYYVSGNHERTPRGPAGTDGGDLYERFAPELRACGVRLMDGRACLLPAPSGREVPGDAASRVALCGLRDPWPLTRDEPGEWERASSAVVARARGLAAVVMTLSHRPERHALYERWGSDLTLSGHAHGGQVRLPGVGALVAPNQGWLPKVDRGLFELRGGRALRAAGGRAEGPALVVSAGLGTSVARLRLLCPPELVVVRLTRG